MRLPATFLLLALSASAAPPQSSSHPAYWRYTHPKTEVLIGVDWKAIKSSVLAKRITGDLEMFKAASVLPKDFQGLGHAGLDFFEVDRVLISMPAQPKNSKGLAGKDTQGVIAVQGKFDLPALRKAASGKSSKSYYKGVELLGSPGSGGMYAGIVNSQLILLGERAMLQAAVDNHTAASPEMFESDLFQRATQLSTQYDLWFISAMPPKAIAGANLPSQLKVFGDVEGLEGGLSLKDGLSLDLMMIAASAPSAQGMASALQAMVSLAAASAAQKNPEAVELLKKLQVGAREDEVTLAIRLSQPELDKAVDSARAGFTQRNTTEWTQVRARPAVRGAQSLNVATLPAASAPPAVPAAPPAPAEPPKPLEVKIFNAEGGTRTLTLTPQ